MTEPVRYALDRGIATITLDSPTNRNALSAALVAGLESTLAQASADADVRAIVITHTGSTFCAGNDLREASTADGAQRSTARLVTVLRTILELPKPVIARVDGHVRAGGIGLIGACDLAIATSTTTFAFTEVRIGIAPAMISLLSLKQMPARAASRYMLTGEKFDGRTAAATGLLTECVEDAAALDAALARLLDELRQGSPNGLAETKKLTTAALLADFDARADQLQQTAAALLKSADAREGLSAFLEKRPASWMLPTD